MAVKNKVISNTKTGQSIRFLQTAADTGGQLLEMESTYNEYSIEPVPHFHPFQEEEFMVLEGEISVRLHDGVKILKQGDTLHIPANKVHSMWNHTSGKTIVNWRVRPAMETEFFLETAMGLAKDGKVNAGGNPGLLQAALMLNKYNGVFRLARPPFYLQRFLFIALSPLAWIVGYRPSYKDYLD